MMMPGRSPRSDRFGVKAIVLAAAVAAIVAALAIWISGRGGSSGDDPAAVSSYADAAHRLSQEGGRVVVEGIKPGIDALYAGSLAPPAFRTNAGGWRADLERVRTEFAALSVPSSLRAAATLYDKALRGYEAAVDAFVAASQQPADQLKHAISSASSVASNADHVYDQADAAVTAELARLGLPTTPPLPSG